MPERERDVNAETSRQRQERQRQEAESRARADAERRRQAELAAERERQRQEAERDAAIRARTHSDISEDERGKPGPPGGPYVPPPVEPKQPEQPESPPPQTPTGAYGMGAVIYAPDNQNHGYITRYVWDAVKKQYVAAGIVTTAQWAAIQGGTADGKFYGDSTHLYRPSSDGNMVDQTLANDIYNRDKAAPATSDVSPETPAQPTGPITPDSVPAPPPSAQWRMVLDGNGRITGWQAYNSQTGTWAASSTPPPNGTRYAMFQNGMSALGGVWNKTPAAAPTPQFTWRTTGGGQFYDPVTGQWTPFDRTGVTPFRSGDKWYRIDPTTRKFTEVQAPGGTGNVPGGGVPGGGNVPGVGGKGPQAAAYRPAGVSATTTVPGAAGAGYIIPPPMPKIKLPGKSVSGVWGYGGA